MEGFLNEHFAQTAFLSRHRGKDPPLSIRLLVLPFACPGHDTRGIRLGRFSTKDKYPPGLSMRNSDEDLVLSKPNPRRPLSRMHPIWDSQEILGLCCGYSTQKRCWRFLSKLDISGRRRNSDDWRQFSPSAATCTHCPFVVSTGENGRCYFCDIRVSRPVIPFMDSLRSWCRVHPHLSTARWVDMGV